MRDVAAALERAALIIAPGHASALNNLSNHLAASGGATTPQGMILPAWAVDANGTNVETRYEVSGNTVTQDVEHNAPGVAYPVVADPKVYYTWW